ncbi:MAG: AMP-binding protein [Verrucomicrobia bacterium]|nr:AMP-binding protein [Verrucomicrobiota bacterium]
MTDSNILNSAGWVRQQEIHSRCYHPSGDRVDFSEKEINGSIPERFERQVEQQADRIAFTDETHTLTYQELNIAANRIAHVLDAEPVEDEEPVIALMDEGATRVSTFLGVLKSGKCHVGVSPELPFDRQQFMIEQSEARIILVEHQYHELGLRLAGKHLKVIDIDEETGAVTGDNPGIEIRADQRCWMVYTSGSTGQPKGVTQTHRNILHDMRTYVEHFNISPPDRMSTVMSLTTSGGCFGALMALGNGATLCRIDVQGRGVEHMASEVARQELTIWGGVPSLFRQWMISSLPEYPHLRLVWFGGEAVHARDFELYRNNLSPSCLFVNRLGSTETCCTRMYFADHQTRISGSTVPVGYPVRGQDIFLEDAEGKRVEAPGSGEVVVSSAYLSPGYWKRPDLTQSAYTSLEDEADMRLFHTGDLGQMDADGCLTFSGRKDFQVQIRDFHPESADLHLTPSVK